MVSNLPGSSSAQPASGHALATPLPSLARTWCEGAVALRMSTDRFARQRWPGAGRVFVAACGPFLLDELATSRPRSDGCSDGATVPCRTEPAAAGVSGSETYGRWRELAKWC
jgi:hypothetical protein